MGRKREKIDFLLKLFLIADIRDDTLKGAVCDNARAADFSLDEVKCHQWAAVKTQSQDDCYFSGSPVQSDPGQQL